MPEPAEDLVLVMGKSLLGSSADFASTQALNAIFGTGESSDAGRLDQIDKSIANVSAEVVEAQKMLGEVQIESGKIRADIAALSALIQDVEIQAALAKFVSLSDEVAQTYMSYNDFLGGAFATTDPGQRAAAVGSMVGLLSFENISALSLALTGIEDVIDPGLAEAKGLIQYQADVVCDATITFSQNADLFVASTSMDVDTEGGLSAGIRLLSGGHDAALAAVDTLVAPLFRAFVATQLQGLILLNLAWAGGVHDDQVSIHSARMTDTLTKMAGFYDGLVPRIVAQVASNLEKFCKPLSPPARTSLWSYFWIGATTGRIEVDGVPYPKDDTWVMWNYGQDIPDNGWDLVEAPWLYGQRFVARVESRAAAGMGPMMTEIDGFPRTVEPFSAPLPASLAFTTAFGGAGPAP